MHLSICIVCANHLQHFIFRHICSQLCTEGNDANFLTCTLFGPDVCLGVLSLSDEDDCQAWCLQKYANNHLHRKSKKPTTAEQLNAPFRKSL